jgi:hypothetical protein
VTIKELTGAKWHLREAGAKTSYHSREDSRVLVTNPVVVENGRCSFNGLQHSRPKGHVQFYALDILVYREETSNR